MKQSPNVTIRKLQHDGTMKTVRHARARIVPATTPMMKQQKTDTQRDREMVRKLRAMWGDKYERRPLQYFLLRAIRYGRRQERAKIKRSAPQLVLDVGGRQEAVGLLPPSDLKTTLGAYVEHVVLGNARPTSPPTET